MYIKKRDGGRRGLLAERDLIWTVRAVQSRIGRSELQIDGPIWYEVTNDTQASKRRVRCYLTHVFGRNHYGLPRP